VLGQSRVDSLHPGWADLSRQQAGELFSSFFHYLGKSLWPVDLRLEFVRQTPGPTRSLASWRAGACAGDLGGGAGRVAGAQRCRRLALVRDLAGPVSGVVATGRQWVSDRFSYLPHWGLAVGIVWALAGARPWGSRARAAGALAVPRC